MANMFYGSMDKQKPNDLESCYKSHDVERGLWSWSGTIEDWGKILFWIIVIAGIINSITTSIVSTEEIRGTFYTYTETKTEFSFEIFLTSLLSTGFYAFLEYCLYHIVALLIGSLASIVQNTRITADIAIYKAAKDETGANNSKQDKKDEWSSKAAKENPTEKAWACGKCGYVNSSGIYCKDCGEYKEKAGYREVENPPKTNTAEEKTLSKEWTCKKCGEKNPSGMYCKSCGEYK